MTVRYSTSWQTSWVSQASENTANSKAWWVTSSDRTRPVISCKRSCWRHSNRIWILKVRASSSTTNFPGEASPAGPPKAEESSRQGEPASLSEWCSGLKASYAAPQEPKIMNRRGLQNRRTAFSRLRLRKKKPVFYHSRGRLDFVKTELCGL